jgi:two-component system, response regulator, stage 0 sporulation protein F
MRERCIVVVDDDQGIQESFDAILGDEYSIHYESNGIEAIKSILIKQPKLIFLDIKIPGMDGTEVLKWIKSNNIKVEIYIITASPYPIYRNLAEMYKVGFISKPFDVQEIELITSELMH